MTTAEPPSNGAEVDTARHLRVLEERYMNLRHKAQLADEKLLSAEEKLNTEIKTVTAELTEIRRSIADVQETILALQGEMAHAASQYDLKTLEKYVGYWQPMHFVTKEELMRNRNVLKDQTGR